MKYLVILMLLIVGCESEKSPNTVNVVGLKSELANTKDQLNTCQAQLEVYRNNSNSSLYNDSAEESKPSEPEYETVDRYDIQTKFGYASCYSRNNNDDDDIACGMTFYDCKDGYTYRCMVDVKYKIVKEEKLIEKE